MANVCNVLTAIFCIFYEMFLVLWEAMETIVDYLTSRNRLVCWLKLVASLVLEVFSTLVMAGVTLCLSTYFMITESDEQKKGKINCTFQEDICALLRCTDIRSILARSNHPGACGCCGQYRLPFVSDCDTPLVDSCEFPDVFNEYACHQNTSISLTGGSDMYCFEHYGRGKDNMMKALGAHGRCGLSSFRTLKGKKFHSQNHADNCVEFHCE